MASKIVQHGAFQSPADLWFKKNDHVLHLDAIHAHSLKLSSVCAPSPMTIFLAIKYNNLPDPGVVTDICSLAQILYYIMVYQRELYDQLVANKSDTIQLNSNSKNSKIQHISCTNLTIQ